MTNPGSRSRAIRVRLATEGDRPTIYGLRHEVYARELHQHRENEEKALRDSLDEDNVYIVAEIAGAIAGFISITTPRNGLYSLDKYLRRDEIPFALDEGTYETRILTVLPAYRGTGAAFLLMYAAFRWIEAIGGTRIVSIGRREVRNLYAKAGLRAFGREFQSGAVVFRLMSERVAAMREHMSRFGALLERFEEVAQWDLVVPFHKPAECFHGGAFFDAIGDEFDHLDRSASVINADVLDAWFPPSPRVVSALREYLPWMARTSPPTSCEGMIRSIARTRGVDAKTVLPGAGSSSLIFLALREWLSATSHVLLPEPAYGEYAHVLEKVIRCRVDRLVLSRENQYRIDLLRMLRALRAGYDLLVLVNPDSPTGQHIPREELEAFLRQVPAQTLVWIDETYTDYLGPNESLETFAASRSNVIICKSMSKVYALSGLRCAYLCAPPHLLERLRAITPPWAVSLPGQVAAVAALKDRDYYAERYRQTAVLRAELTVVLASIPSTEIIPGVANFLLCHLPESGPSAADVVARCRQRGLFIRDTSNMGANLGQHAIRIAVKDRETLARMAGILLDACVEACTPLVAGARETCTLP
jgi:histidinol-phosphate/aromatic aminotransferase/cobyric acid decarboxylase-like protein/GNAT superfamily N-acetyltransferase